MRLHPLLAALAGIALLVLVGHLGQLARPMLKPEDLARALPPWPVALPEPGAGPLMRSPRDCLALAMYWEAKGEGIVGMAAVGSVILNRAHASGFPDNVCAVVRQGGEAAPCHFSFWCDGRSDWPRETEPWQLAVRLAKTLLEGRVIDPTEGALYYHATRIRPYWAKEYEPTVRIGRHRFYRQS
jgi:spore germination cell wall hydrolase CwlJ-like protein